MSRYSKLQNSSGGRSNTFLHVLSPRILSQIIASLAASWAGSPQYHSKMELPNSSNSGTSSNMKRILRYLFSGGTAAAVNLGLLFKFLDEK